MLGALHLPYSCFSVAFCLTPHRQWFKPKPSAARPAGTWGDHVTLQAVADAFGLRIVHKDTQIGLSSFEIRPMARRHMGRPRDAAGRRGRLWPAHLRAHLLPRVGVHRHHAGVGEVTPLPVPQLLGGGVPHHCRGCLYSLENVPVDGPALKVSPARLRKQIFVTPPTVAFTDPLPVALPQKRAAEVHETAGLEEAAPPVQLGVAGCQLQARPVMWQ